MKYPCEWHGVCDNGLLALARQLGQLHAVKEDMASMRLVLPMKAAYSPPVAEMVGLTGLSPNCRGALGQYDRIGEGDEDNG